ncbi:MAG: ATP-dependent RNA helicase HrpA [Syntrophus sp. PtaB.Bin001]|nr:MAG: ATP-dependent RNA helicase HrpA [Syntrophus sp. PtaB.Bin001]
MKIREKGGDSFLRMTMEDVLARLPNEEELSLYPDEVSVGGRSYRCVYRFDPGKEDDGVTLKVPENLLNDIPATAVDWMVPGLLLDRVLSLLRGLPKEYRKRLQPLAQTAEYAVKNLDASAGLLIPALAGLLREKLKVDIPSSVWSDDKEPDHLRLRFSVVDKDGSEKAAGRDLTYLQKNEYTEKNSRAFDLACRQWEKSKLKEWNFGDLPEIIDLTEKGSFMGCAYPALKPGTDGVDLRLYKTREEATNSHKEGVAALYCIHFKRELKDLKKALILPEPLRTWADGFNGIRDMEKQLLEKVKIDLFAVNIRTEGRFHFHAKTVKNKILSYGQEMITEVEPLLKAYHETAKAVSRLEIMNRANTAGREFLNQIRQEMDRLLPPDFLFRYDSEGMKNVPRYLKALNIRADRGIFNMEKDRIREKEILPFVTRLNELYENLPPFSTDEKKQAMKEFSMMIEEYRVSIFAQELKTAFPVSARRLKEKLAIIDHMF